MLTDILKWKIKIKSSFHDIFCSRTLTAEQKVAMIALAMYNICILHKTHILTMPYRDLEMSCAQPT